jgi:hypothetical protein
LHHNTTSNTTSNTTQHNTTKTQAQQKHKQTQTNTNKHTYNTKQHQTHTTQNKTTQDNTFALINMTGADNNVHRTMDAAIMSASTPYSTANTNAYNNNKCKNSKYRWT